MKVKDLCYDHLFTGKEGLLDFEIEDSARFTNVAQRMVQDVGLTVYVTAKLQHVYEIDEETTKRALDLIHPTYTIREAPSEAFIYTGLVRDLLARVPLPIDDMSFTLISQFTNYHLGDLVSHAAMEAWQANLTFIKISHFSTYCEKLLPYPLNLLCPIFSD